MARRNVPCGVAHEAFKWRGRVNSGMCRLSFRFTIAIHPSPLALQDVVPPGFFLSRLSASISSCARRLRSSFPLDRLPAEIRALLPSVSPSTALGCSLHVVAGMRRLSISIRSSCRPLCNLPADDVTTSARKGTNLSSDSPLHPPSAPFGAHDRVLRPSQFCARAAGANSLRTLSRNSCCETARYETRPVEILVDSG